MPSAGSSSSGGSSPSTAVPSAAPKGSSAEATAPAASDGTFGQAAIDAVVASHRKALAKACAAGLKRARDRRLDLIFEIDATGAVTDATAAGGGSAERPLRQCVEERIKTWKFPEPGDARTIQASLVF